MIISTSTQLFSRIYTHNKKTNHEHLNDFISRTSDYY